ncbi:hypothetical protein [Sphingomonas bacterium]|uniref:hypothetical protein n=1 Tax=Sphingomonas bacterium TaxID=1895847 RepID=UPI0015774093|nr:hypothetical protein [Sphingomonas bacterium]
MAEDNTVSFMAEQFRRLNSRFDEVERRLGTFEGKMEDRLANIERRLTSQTQIEQAMIGHLASIHASVDDLRAQFLGVDRRLSALEAHV